MDKQYQPKGSMCANCKNKNNDCSVLPFELMPPLKTEGMLVIVKCIEFEKE